MQILIVDDEKNIRLSLKNIVEDLNHTAITAETREECFSILKNYRTHLLFLDVRLNTDNGIEMLKTIKEKYKDDIQVIMISGESGIREAVEAIKYGAFDFLEKPLSLPKIKITIKKCLDFIQINSDYQNLKKDIEKKYTIIGESKPVQKMKKTIFKVAATDSKVLIRGESGTGKELVAFAIHNNSRRAKKPFIKFNSAAIPTELVESELFGYEKGAFTGAHKNKKGKLELADSGTLLLDEIGDMSLSAQAKILRVIQEGEFERVGGSKTKKVDTRILAATHKNLEKMVEEGTFRKDLYYRLNVVPIEVPPLRERTEDIKLLIEYFSEIFSSELKVRRKKFTESAIQEIMTWKFPGNIRELRNFIERLYILQDENIIERDSLPYSDMKKNKDSFWVITKDMKTKKQEFETRYINTQLELHNNVVSDTADAIGMHQSNLSRKIKQLGIEIK